MTKTNESTISLFSFQMRFDQLISSLNACTHHCTILQVIFIHSQNIFISHWHRVYCHLSVYAIDINSHRIMRGRTYRFITLSIYCYSSFV